MSSPSGRGLCRTGSRRGSARLPAEASDLLRAAAILGDRTELSVTAALAGLDMTAALAAASALVRSDLLRQETPVEFMHPVVRTAVLEDMTDGRASERASASGGSPRSRLERFRRIRRRTSRRPFRHTTQSSWRHFVMPLPVRSRRGAPQAAVAYLRRALEEPPRGRRTSGRALRAGRRGAEQQRG